MGDVIDILKDLIGYKSITPSTDGIYDYITNELKNFEVIYEEKFGVSNILIYKKFTDTKKHLCLAGHVDVVPAGETWKSDPFTAIVDGEYIYGRGTQDMKSGVASYISVLKEVDFFDGTISMLLTSDEEGEAKFGTVSMLEKLKEMNFLPDYAIICEPCSNKFFGDTIKVGRRGSINGVINILGKQGHVAYPSKCDNPVTKLSAVLPQLSGYNLDSGDDFYEPSTIVITDIRGGYEVTNLTANSIKLMFNVRNNTLTTVDDVKNHISKVCKDIEYNLTLEQTSDAFITDSDNVVVKKLKEVVKDILNIYPSLETSGGTSDARFFSRYGVPTVEFGVVNDRIHSTNERTIISDVRSLKKVLYYFIKKF